MSDFKLITPEEKIERKIVPYMTFPIINSCNLHCKYCGNSGEMTISEKNIFDVDYLTKWVNAAYEIGIQKFRITGGEPFLHPQLRFLIFEVFKYAKELLVNTNGTLIVDKKKIWLDSPNNTRYVVNFHGAKESTYDKITGTKGLYQKLREGIEMLADEQLLHRLNIVICKDNYDELFDVIDYCRKIGTDLKIQDVVAVPWQFNEWKTIYYDTSEIEKELERRASHIRDHRYARGFGTPTKIYTIDGVNVTFKSIRNGSHYEMENICNKCKYFPCHEGVYDLFVFPEGVACACNWTDLGKALGDTESEKIHYLIEKFQNTVYVKADMEKISKGMCL